MESDDVVENWERLRDFVRRYRTDLSLDKKSVDSYAQLLFKYCYGPITI